MGSDDRSAVDDLLPTKAGLARRFERPSAGNGRVAPAACQLMVGARQPELSWMRISLAEAASMLETTRDCLAATGRIIERSRQAAQQDLQNVKAAREGMARVLQQPPRPKPG